MMAPIFSSENIYRQFLHCRRNKRNTINALRFEYGLEENLLILREELQYKTYRPSRSVCFVVAKPKLREIFAADFRDRVVHHILVNALDKVWEPRFIHDSYACRKGKGTHRAVKQLHTFMRKVSRNNTRKAYFIQLDIRGFFFNINKEILYRIIAKQIRNPGLLWLTRAVIFHDCTENVAFKGKRALLNNIPVHKTLFNTENKRGLPIGNLTSQFFANVYLNELDQFVKHHLKSRYYIRYCDDFVLLHKEKAKLLEWREKIREFLKTGLRLVLNDQRQTLGPISNGIDFLGYIVRPDYLLVRQRVVNRLKERLSDFESRLIKKEDPPYVKVIYDYRLLDKLRATLASYFGHFKWANSNRLQMSLLKRYGFLEWFFKIEGWKIMPKYKIPDNIPTCKLQYRYFKTKFSGDVIFFKKGKYYEFFEDDRDIALTLGLKKMNRHSEGNTAYGFPIWLEKFFSARIRRMGKSLTVITEGERYLTGIKERFPKYRLIAQF
jgi:RNA-directed DNA polymerase